jgi:hypothetical protein
MMTRELRFFYVFEERVFVIHRHLKSALHGDTSITSMPPSSKAIRSAKRREANKKMMRLGAESSTGNGTEIVKTSKRRYRERFSFDPINDGCEPAAQKQYRRENPRSSDGKFRAYDNADEGHSSESDIERARRKPSIQSSQSSNVRV